MRDAEPISTMKTRIRQAIGTDAADACVVLRRSITECCEADHRGDPAVLEVWLRNKTVEGVAGWIGSRAKYVVVAELDGRLVGAAMLDICGVIELCYLIPEARFKGIGKAMLQALEAEARKRGIEAVELVSTRTAHAFYLRHGYRETGEGVDCFGLQAPRMRKTIAERA